GAEFRTMAALPEVNRTLFSVQGNLEYSVQVAGSLEAAGSFTLDTVFYSRTNDMFESSTHLEGTNFIYSGNFSLATDEPNEPPSGAPNTVWASWTAPFPGRASFNLASAEQFQF